MTRLALSEMGYKLVKAYEGYRPVDRTLVSGQRVVGYGHRLFDEPGQYLSKEEAEALLEADMAPFEDMINENVHAPLTQSQFDALCSFAFNIGPKAFLESDVLRALNNGRPLDAANGFDIWRKSEIDGKTYVVDALMRRRTAEKALFLRPEGRQVKASRIDLPPVEDETAALISTNDALPVFSRNEVAGLVKTVPYDTEARASVMDEKKPAEYNRRREDGLAGALMLSEVYNEDDEYEDEDVFEQIEASSPDALEEDSESAIAAKAAPGPSLVAVEDEKLKDRLDALIEDIKGDTKQSDMEDWPESLINAEIPPDDMDGERAEDISEDTNVITLDIPSRELPPNESVRDVQIIDVIETDTNNEREDSASKYIKKTPRAELEMATETKANSGASLPYWIMILLGSTLFGGSIAAILRGSKQLLGEFGPFLAIIGVFIGALMLFGALYYAIRLSFKRS